MKKFLIFLILIIFIWGNLSFSASCPSKTKAGYNFIYFVGRLDGLGGDKEVKVWFEYGDRKENLSKKTKELVLTEPQIFCLKVTKLESCKTYYYRAAAKNSAGTNYGETKEIKTLCRNKNNSSIIKKIKESVKWVVF